MISPAQHLANMAIASGICTAMIGYGTLKRRADGSRRWLFLVTGLMATAATAYVLVISENFVETDGLSLMLLGVGCLAVGAFAFGIGVRGRCAGDHPHCRRCGFDLFGKPEESNRCSECGSDLQGERAIVVGVRERRRRLIVAGVFFLLFGGMAVGSVARHVSFWHYVPTWVLLKELDSPPIHPEGEAELELRIRMGSLSTEQLCTAADWAATNPPSVTSVGYTSSNIIRSLSYWANRHSGSTPEPVRRVISFNAPLLLRANAGLFPRRSAISRPPSSMPSTTRTAR